MADFLIKNTNHWMDSLSHEEVQSRSDIDPSFAIAYKERYQKGDVIEVAEDNHWHDGQHGNGKFLVCRVPFLSLSEATTYMDSWEGEHRRRYRMWFENISDAELDEHQVAPYVYQLNNIDELLYYGQDKVDEA